MGKEPLPHIVLLAEFLDMRNFFNELAAFGKAQRLAVLIR
jgi:hypothetical protein